MLIEQQVFKPCSLPSNRWTGLPRLQIRSNSHMYVCMYCSANRRGHSWSDDEWDVCMYIVLVWLNLHSFSRQEYLSWLDFRRDIMQRFGQVWSECNGTGEFRILLWIGSSPGLLCIHVSRYAYLKMHGAFAVMTSVSVDATVQGRRVQSLRKMCVRTCIEQVNDTVEWLDCVVNFFSLEECKSGRKYYSREWEATRVF